MGYLGTYYISLSHSETGSLIRIRISSVNDFEAISLKKKINGKFSKRRDNLHPSALQRLWELCNFLRRGKRGIRILLRTVCALAKHCSILEKVKIWKHSARHDYHNSLLYFWNYFFPEWNLKILSGLLSHDLVVLPKNF